MAPDRDSIVKKDFPTARQGYDKAAVDAHLAAIADQLDHATLASSASDQVRTIVHAAETSAAQIQRDANDAARATHEEAAQAAHHAREAAGRVSELAAALTQQLDASRRQLHDLLGSLPGTAEPAAAPQKPAAAASEPAAATPEPAAVAPEPAAVAPEPAPVAAPEPAPVAAPEPAAADPAPASSPAGATDETEGARLIALNMALDGSTRDETAKYLDENFELSNSDKLLDEVYSSVEH